jgi:hypothetical protein
VGGKDVVCLDPKTGETRWRHKGEHIQWRQFGRFLPDREDRQMLVSEKSPDGPTWLLAPNGEVLWKKDMGRGIFAPIVGAGPENTDLLLDMTPVGGGFPRLINGCNETLDTFDFMGEVSAEAARGVKGDAGSGFHAYCDDFDGDGLKELLMFNRHRAVIARIVP